jgi:hypothetical protein
VRSRPGQADEPAGQADEPAGQADEPAGQADEPAGALLPLDDVLADEVAPDLPPFVDDPELPSLDEPVDFSLLPDDEVVDAGELSLVGVVSFADDVVASALSARESVR